MTAIAQPSSTDTRTARREERLLRLLERASATSRFTFGERWLFGLGGALVVAGFVAVVIGWAGASRTVLVAGQIPYLLSGGLIGLGLIFLGGFLYFGHWLAVLVREGRERGTDDREDLASLRDSLQEIHRALGALAAGLSQGLPAVAPEPQFNGDGPREAMPPHPFVDDTAPVLLATSTGTMAHRPGCRALAGKPNVRPVSTAEGLRPCGMCRPLDHAGLL